MGIQVADPMEGLTFSPASGAGMGTPDPEAAAAAQASAEQEAAALQAIQAGMQKILFFGLKALRAYIARKMPEIVDEWPDSVLRAPAEAAVPLLQEHMSKIMAVAGQNPNLAMLALSLVPMGMGYMSAAERHARTVQDVTVKPDQVHTDG
jgi:hypothetical protein